MKTFTIDPDDNITVFASPEQIGELREGTGRFATEEELARLAGGWSGTRLVEVWNSLPGVPPVKKFADRKRAVRRIWKAIQGLGPGGNVDVGRSERNTKKVSISPSIHEPRKKTKTEQIIALLKRRPGASLKAIMRARRPVRYPFAFLVTYGVIRVGRSLSANEIKLGYGRTIVPSSIRSFPRVSKSCW